MILVLLRHGETIANQEYNTENRRLIGAWESPMTELNDQGRLQAQKAKECLAGICFDRIYCSDLLRARQTAAIVFPGQKIWIDPRLRERSLGVAEGRLYREVMQDPVLAAQLPDPDRDSLADLFTKKPEGGESYCDVWQRGEAFWQMLQKEPVSRVALVSHYHFLRCLISILQQTDRESVFSRSVANCEPLFFQRRGDAMVAVAKDTVKEMILIEK